MRDEIDRERIEAFLRELGRTFRHHARLYLAGGESMVWRGLRGADGVTRDLDLAYQVEPEHLRDWERSLLDLRDRLRVSVEEAQPADFVPLPPGAEGRAEFVGRYGQVDVFLYDPYSIALGKLGRGHERDFADVRALLAAHVLDPARLVELIDAAIASDRPRSLRFNPVRVRRNLAIVLDPSPASDPGTPA